MIIYKCRKFPNLLPFCKDISIIVNGHWQNQANNPKGLSKIRRNPSFEIPFTEIEVAQKVISRMRAQANCLLFSAPQVVCPFIDHFIDVKCSKNNIISRPRSSSWIQLFLDQSRPTINQNPISH